MLAERAVIKADTSLVHDLCASCNVEPRRNSQRPDILLLHYTGVASVSKAIAWLSDPTSGVSCHYVIDREGRVTQMVAENLRAWHAGISHWAGETDINSRSIGIEIDNPGHALGYPDFAEAQMRAVEALAGDIVTRWGIAPERVLAHSDVAPLRKVDPGEKFDWARLARAGVGLWVEPEPPVAGDGGLRPEDGGPVVARVRDMLRRYGFGVDGEAERLLWACVRAFQLHFRPARVDGRIDQSTITTLERLLAARDRPRPVT